MKYTSHARIAEQTTGNPRKYLEITYLKKVFFIRAYKELSSSTIREQTTQIFKKRAKDLNRNFTKIWIASKHMKRCLTSMIIKKMQIKITVFIFLIFRIAKVNMTDHAQYYW